jgi:peptide/nickel transport system substrate-binding protein
VPARFSVPGSLVFGIGLQGVIGLVALAMIGLVGCRAEVTRDAPADTLVIATAGDAQSLDPHAVTDLASMRMIENLHAPLLQYGDLSRGELLPGIAQEWTTSDDRLTITLTLAAGRVFHTGKPVTSADVKRSLERIRDSGIRGGHFASIERIKTPDAKTVELQLREPSAPLLTHLAHPMNAVLDVEHLESDSPLRFAEAGCGPYQLKSWQRAQEMIHARSENHSASGPETIVLKPMPDAVSRSISLRTGEVDALEQVPPQDVIVLEKASGIRVEAGPGLFWEYLGLNCTVAPLDDPRVRQGIAWAVDREQLVAAIKFGRATPLTAGPIPPDHWAALDEAIYPRVDRKRARALFEEAGFPNGFDLELIVDARRAEQVRTGEMIKQQLRAVGIRVDLRGLEPGLFYRKLNDRDFQATVVGWDGFVEPDEFVYELFRSDGAYNQQGYENAEVDAWIDAARSAATQDERRELYRKIQRRIALDAPMVFLYVNPRIVALRSWVKNYQPHPSGTMRTWTDVRIETPQGEP